MTCELHGHHVTINHSSVLCPMCELESEAIEIRQRIRQAEERKRRESMRIPLRLLFVEKGVRVG